LESLKGTQLINFTINVATTNAASKLNFLISFIQELWLTW